jgi:hypothetical protein
MARRVCRFIRPAFVSFDRVAGNSLLALLTVKLANLCAGTFARESPRQGALWNSRWALIVFAAVGFFALYHSDRII